MVYSGWQGGSEMVVGDEHAEATDDEGVSLRAENARLRAQLESRRDRQRGLFDEAVAAMVVVDRFGNFVEANRAALKLLGYPRNELLVASVADIEPEDGPLGERAHDVLLSVESVARLQHRVVRRDGQLRSVVTSARGLYDTEGRRVGAQAAMLDVSESHEQADEQRLIEEKIQQSQRLETIGNLASGIAHDFNNLLVPILGYSEMVREDLPAADPAREDLAHVITAAHRAKDLVDRILIFSRRRPQHGGPVDARHAVEGALALLRPALPSTIAIESVLPDGPIYVNTDETRVHQVVMNLSTNGYHAMGDGGGTLQISLGRVFLDRGAAGAALAEGEHLRLMVRDTGTGMDERTRSRAFEPFFTTKEVGQGTGMGLSVVHGIVRDCGGEVRIESQLGVGTAVSVVLPIAAGPTGTAAPSGAAPGAMVSGGSESLLVVDDNTEVLSLVERMLSRLGYRVRAFANSRAAFEAFESEPSAFDLVLSDLTMPHITGPQLLALVRRVRANVPMIIMTGHPNSRELDGARELGIESVIPKPIDRLELALALRRALDGT